jgi:hypothetical protein
MKIINSYDSLNRFCSELHERIRRYFGAMADTCHYDTGYDGDKKNIIVSWGSNFKYVVSFAGKTYCLSKPGTGVLLRTEDIGKLFDYISSLYEDFVMETHLPVRIYDIYKKIKRYNCPNIFAIGRYSPVTIKINDNTSATFCKKNLQSMVLRGEHSIFRNNEDILCDILEESIHESVRKRIYPKEIIEMLPELEADENEFVMVDDDKSEIVILPETNDILISFRFDETKVVKLELRVDNFYQENKFVGEDRDRITECAVKCIRELHESKYSRQVMKDVCTRLIILSMSFTNAFKI